MQPNACPSPADLAAVIQHLPQRDQAFARSLANSDRGWTPKQAFWAGKLIARATGHTEDAQPVTGLMPVVAMFDRAAGHLKFPKVTVAKGVVLKRCGPSSRYPGAVNVVSERSAYEPATWYGRIERDGRLTESHAMTEDVRNKLIAIAADPAEAAKRYGKLHGHCCFCRRELSDERSTAVGYGPICAEHYGLPWGEPG